MARMIDADALIEWFRPYLHTDEPIPANVVIEDIRSMPTLTQPPITGDTSDGYHTFNELYRHRAILFSVICNERPEVSWKSKRHHDGTMYDGMFIVGIDTPEGQATYHYDIDPYWNLFRVKELELAPEWDGHTPGEAIRRIGTLTQPNEPLVTGFDVVDTKTWEYPDLEKIALKEDWAKHLMYCDMEGFAIEEDGTLLLLDECGRQACCPVGRFEIRRPPEGEEEEKHVIEITENL